MAGWVINEKTPGRYVATNPDYRGVAIAMEMFGAGKPKILAWDKLKGAQSRIGRESPSFNITMKPQTAYVLVLAGKIEVRLEEEEVPVEAEINIKKLQIEVHAR